VHLCCIFIYLADCQNNSRNSRFGSLADCCGRLLFCFPASPLFSFPAPPTIRESDSIYL